MELKERWTTGYKKGKISRLGPPCRHSVSSDNRINSHHLPPPTNIKGSWLNLCYSLAGRSVLRKPFPEVLTIPHLAKLETEDTVFQIRTNLGW